MGCVKSKSLPEPNLFVFDVIYADTGLNQFFNGKLEITGSHVILHRNLHEPIVWNFDSLRRYGHDEVYFSFESGRRCATGQGIFSFRCTRPEIVFQRLESVIKGRNAVEPNSHPTDIFVTPNVNGRSIAQLNCQNAGGGQHFFVNSLLRTSSVSGQSNHSRSTDTLTPDGNYLEPIANRQPLINADFARLSARVRHSSIGSGPTSPSSYTNILELTQFNTLPATSTVRENIYHDYPSVAPHTSHAPPKLSLDITPTEPAPNTKKLLPKDESMTLYENCDIATTCDSLRDENDNRKTAPQTPASPTDSTKANNLYMNVQIAQSAPNPSNDLSSPLVLDAQNNLPGTPPVSGNAINSFTTSHSYNNNLNNFNNNVKKEHKKSNGIFGLNRAFSVDPNRCYENLDIGAETPLAQKYPRYSRPEIFAHVDLPYMDNSEPSTPNRTVNYIVLDLDNTSSSITSNLINNNFDASPNSSPYFAANSLYSQGSDYGISNMDTSITSNASIVTSISITNGLCPSLLPPESPQKRDLGYAMIDYDKTVALSCNLPADNEGSRKTRHNSSVPVSQQSVSD